MDTDESFERLVDDECVRIAQHSNIDAFKYAAGRVMVRTLRLGCGAVTGTFGWWVGSPIAPAMHKPLAALTLGDLVGAVGAGICTLLLFALAWVIAFGPGPGQSTLRQRAVERIHRRQQAQAQAQAEVAKNAAKVAAVRARYAWFGRPGLAILGLNDTLERRPWAAVLLTLALYAGLGMLVYWISRSMF